MADVPKEDRIMFFVAQADDGSTVVTLGLTDKAIAHVKADKTHEVDFRKLGLPLVITAFYAPTQEAAMEKLKAEAAKVGVPVVDGRGVDFSIPKPRRH